MTGDVFSGIECLNHRSGLNSSCVSVEDVCSVMMFIPERLQQQQQQHVGNKSLCNTMKGFNGVKADIHEADSLLSSALYVFI